jgi:hypothetical protein
VVLADGMEILKHTATAGRLRMLRDTVMSYAVRPSRASGPVKPSISSAVEPAIADHVGGQNGRQPKFNGWYRVVQRHPWTPRGFTE